MPRMHYKPGASRSFVTAFPLIRKESIIFSVTPYRAPTFPSIFQAPNSRHSFRQLPFLTRNSDRNFTSSARLHKKGGKQENKHNVEDAATRIEGVDPFDFSELQAGIQRALEKLQDDLSKLRAGGRFNPDIIEAFRVRVDKGSKDTIRLGDLAQALPKGGRTVMVLVGEADHVKPITSAILSSPHSLNPTPSAHSPLELHIQIPPPTQESRRQAVDRAAKAGETAGHAVRQARGIQQKKLRGMSLAKTVRPDDLKKAGDKMEKVVEGGYGEVKKIVEGAKKVLEQG